MLYGNIKKYIKSYIEKIYDGYDKLNGEYVDLDNTQYWSKNEILSFQEERLRKIIKYSYENISAYRSRFDSKNLKPDDVRGIDDLWKIPILTRSEVQGNDGFINKKLIKGIMYTGGSTGEPLKYYDSRRAKIIRHECHRRGWAWNGYVYGKKIVNISSSYGVNHEDNVLNIKYDLRLHNIKNIINKIEEFCPEHIRGNVSSLYVISKYVNDNKINLGVELRSISTICENLYSFQREEIENAFKSKIFEEYVCNDGGACAWECEAHTGLHHAMERSIIENINDNMIVTDLWNLAMPFIRYSNGDSFTFLGDQCACGRRLDLIKVRGKNNDLIITPYGPVPPSQSLSIWYEKDSNDISENFRYGVTSFQFVQKEFYVLIVYLVVNKNFNRIMLEKFKKKLEIIFKGMNIEIILVENLEKTIRGKTSFIINEDKNLLRKFYEEKYSDNIKQTIK